MAEVRQSPNGGDHHPGLGLFATKDYNVGDFIIQNECPLLILTPQSKEEESLLVNLLNASTTGAKNNSEPKQHQVEKGQRTGSNDKESKDPSVWDLIPVHESVLEDNVGKFKGMVQAGLCAWKALQNSDESRMEQVLELYHPQDDTKSEVEQELLRIAKLALECVVRVVKTNEKTITKDMETKLLKVLLIWSCNSFEGGRIYSTISRINHSCNPNSMIEVATDSKTLDNQSVRALTGIRAGEEITISYLGLFLYAERPVRQAILKQTKHFVCECSRCQQEVKDPCLDTASSIPCPIHHPREQGGRQLDEETQYDDDKIATYVCGWSLDHPSKSFVKDNAPTPQTKKEMKTSDAERLTNAMEQVRNKVVKFLQGKRPPNKKLKPSVSKEEEDEDSADKLLQSEMLDQHIRLASSVMGARHWTTNLLLLFQLDDLLQSIHNEMLLHDEAPDFTVLAEAIDMLQRLVHFVDGLSVLSNMDHRKGHLLSSVMIGTARALVSLSDVKSQRYAVEWVDPIRDYVRVFESEGLQKVVDTIANAYKQNNSDTPNEDSKRRAKDAPKEHGSSKKTKRT